MPTRRTTKTKLISPSAPVKTEGYWLIRGLDIIIAGISLLSLTPLFLIIGLAVKLSSPGPVFYRAQRVGKNERLFRLNKFRSMYLDSNRLGPGITHKNDARITPVGRFLRWTKLDEIPQLINVFWGDMSIVGPRPEDPRYVKLYTTEQRQVLTVRPGITSPASIYYREEESLLDKRDAERVYREQIMPHKLALDLAYLRRRTTWSDLSLLFRTIFAIFYVKTHSRKILSVRNRHLLLIDLVALMLTPILAVTLRVERFDWWADLGWVTISFTLLAILIKLPIFFRFGLYNRYWHFGGVNDLTRIVAAVGLSTFILTAIVAGAYPLLESYGMAMYRSVPLVDGLLTFLMVGGVRFGLRGLNYYLQQRSESPLGERVLVIGAGMAGILAVTEMQTNAELNMEPVAFVDDDPKKVGSKIRELPVAGTREDIVDIIKLLEIDKLLIAMPSIPLTQRLKIVELCKKTGVETYNLPGVYELLAGYKSISRVPKINIENLLQRKPIEIDRTELTQSLTKAKVLVTGAGGSIGSELCRQIAQIDPAEIVLVGHGENSIFEINLELQMSYPQLVTYPVILNVRDRHGVNWAIEKYQPDIIFHAAAHKHVPFMEDNTSEAIINNVLGTRNMVRAAEQYGIERFVLISTDKAVNPSSIMGATKRLAELLVLSTAHRSGKNYAVVRFGNVLGSRGSVVPIFQQQIAEGGPITVTHPDMTRYFMTIPEAVQLVLQASNLAEKSKIFVLDMGQPIQILSLAHNLIEMSGLKVGRDIEIVYTGIRPGEKIHEELFLKTEDYGRTKHSKIFGAVSTNFIETEVLEGIVTDLIQVAGQSQTSRTNEELRILLTETCKSIEQTILNPSASKSSQAASSFRERISRSWPSIASAN